MPKTRIGEEARDSGGILDTLSRRYHAVLMRYFVRRGVGVHDAQDLVQDVFARLSKRDSLEDVERLEGFIFAMAANASIDYVRRRRVRVDGTAALIDVTEKDGDFSPERVLEGRQELAVIVNSLNEMPERMRHIFILARLENMTRPEIARRLGISKSLVDQQIDLATACLAERRRRMS